LFFNRLLLNRKRPSDFLRIWLLVEVSGYLIAASVSAQSSPYVPVMDKAYTQLDALVAVGLVEVPSLVQRPYSRLTFSRLVREARRNLDGLSDTKKRFAELLISLEKQFAAELELLCLNAEPQCKVVNRAMTLREVRADFTKASSPERDMRTAYSREDFIQGVVNPLLQRNFGRVISDGQTAGLESTLDIQLSSGLSAQLRPRIWFAKPSNAAKTGGLTLLDGYLRAAFGGFALDFGRNHFLRGRAKDSGPLLSNNSKGLDMVRFSRESPWLLGFLGSVTGAAWVVDLGSQRRVPHSKLIGFEVGVRPMQYLELGLSLINQQGGEGSPEASFGERLRDIFLIMPAGAEISDKILSADIVLSFPSYGIELFIGALSTDPDYELSYRIVESWWDEAIWTAGLKWSGLGQEGRIDLWLEGHHAGLRPHTHHQFKEGMAINNQVIGNALGPLAHSLQSGVGWTGREDILKLELFHEVYSGDDWENEGTPFRWMRVKDNPDEVRLRLVTAWSRNHGAANLQSTVQLGYEHVNRFDFTDMNRSNYLAQVYFTWIPS